MKKYKVTIKGEDGVISYDVFKRNEKSAISLGQRVSNEAFYGQKTEILIKEI